LIGVLLICLTACASLPSNLEAPPEQLASLPATSGSLAALHGSMTLGACDGCSGFRLLDVNADALTWRLVLLDEAVSSLDLMYYLWYGDDSGRLMLRHVIDAAERGVRVRLMVDDLLMIGSDQILVALHAHPNIDVRLFNPWTNRYAGRGLEFVARTGRLNARMHNKLLIADNHAVILGGRNIGDYYFGLSSSYNFHDLDILGVGPVAQQASAMFDDIWNSSWVVSAEALPAEVDADFLARRAQKLSDRLQSADALRGFPLQARSWTEKLEQSRDDFHFGPSRLIYDRLEGDRIVEGLTESLRTVLLGADTEIQVANAYIIPGQGFIDGIRSLTDTGIRVQILTNSLASHDVPAVNSHYQKWRKPLLSAGAELYELRSDPEIKSQVDTAPVVSKFTGFHTKAFVVDRRRVFVGSLNFDPRSVNINTEMGILVDSPGLGAALAKLVERDITPQNAWKVSLTETESLAWTNSEKTVTRQPARNFWQRIADAFFKLLPASQF
jgi:putative cardiolipin synthase